MEKTQNKNTKIEFIITIQGKKTERNLKQLEEINKWFKFYLDIEADDNWSYESEPSEYVLGKYIVNEFYWGRIARKYFFEDVVWNVSDFDVNVTKKSNNITITFN